MSELDPKTRLMMASIEHIGPLVERQLQDHPDNTALMNVQDRIDDLDYSYLLDVNNHRGLVFRGIEGGKLTRLRRSLRPFVKIDGDAKSLSDYLAGRIDGMLENPLMESFKNFQRRGGRNVSSLAK